jgi:hypothetical protein
MSHPVPVQLQRVAPDPFLPQIDNKLSHGWAQNGQETPDIEMEGFSMRMQLLAGAAALALCSVFAGQAMADPSGTLGGGYDYVQLPGSSAHLNDWNLNGSIAAPITSNITVQGDASYDYIKPSSGSGSLHSANVSGTAFWQAAQGRIGATAGYNEFGSSTGSGIHFENYGAFGTFYASPQVTLGLKGGEITGVSGLHLGYFGAEVVGYVTPDVALSGTIDYASQSSFHVTTYGANVEWLASHTVPISLTGGYTYTEFSGVHLNTYMIGAKFYFGKGSSLEDHQRTGAETWGVKQSTPSFLF